MDLYGQAADMDLILELARRYLLKALEDTSNAFGASTRAASSAPRATPGSCPSFLGAFRDRGLVFTNEDHVAQQARILWAHGIRKKYFNEIPGYNSWLDELQEATLRVKLPNVDACNAMRRHHAETYDTVFRMTMGLCPPSGRRMEPASITSAGCA